MRTCIVTDSTPLQPLPLPTYVTEGEQCFSHGLRFFFQSWARLLPWIFVATIPNLIRAFLEENGTRF